MSDHRQWQTAGLTACLQTIITRLSDTSALQRLLRHSPGGGRPPPVIMS